MHEGTNVWPETSRLWTMIMPAKTDEGKATNEKLEIASQCQKRRSVI